MEQYMAEMETYAAAMQEYSEAMQNSVGAGGDAAAFAERVTELVELTRKSDAESVAAWQSLLVASGIAVGRGAEAVQVSGASGYGIPVSMPELRLHALAAATDTFTPLTELAYVLEGMGFPDGSLADALYEDLTGASARDLDFAQVFHALNPTVFGEHDPDPKIIGAGGGLFTVDEVLLSTAQVNLVLRRLSAELLQYLDADGATGPVASGAPRAGIATVSTFVAAGGPCTSEGDPWKDDARAHQTKFKALIFAQVLELIPESGLGNLVKMGLAAGGVLASLAAVGTKMKLLRADMNMPNAPLVRTKDTTPGEVRDVVFRFTLDENTMREVNACLNAMLGPYGFEFNTDQAGAMEGIDVNLKLVDKDRVWLDVRDGTETYVGQTDSDGRITFGLEGRPQKRLIPDAADPDDVTVTVRADANVNNSGFMKELLSLPWTALGGPFGVVPELFQRWKLSSFERPAPVRDWTQESEFDVELTATVSGHHGQNESGVSECGPWSLNKSTSGSGTIESPEPVRVIAELVSDGVASGVLFKAAHEDLPQPEFLPHAEDGVKLFEIPVRHEVSQSQQEPGAEPMPEHYRDPSWSGCGDGSGTGLPAPDCGTRSYVGFISVATTEDAVFHLVNEHEIERQWRYCGNLWPARPLSAVPTLRLCASPSMLGGDIPAGIFDPEENYFETSGVLTCTKDDREGLLDLFELSWTLTFCRIVDEERAC